MEDKIKTSHFLSRNLEDWKLPLYKNTGVYKELGEGRYCKYYKLG